MSPFVLNKLSFVRVKMREVEYDWGKGWDRKSEDFIPCLCKTVDHPPYRTWVRVWNQGLSERLDFDSHDLQMSHPGGGDKEQGEDIANCSDKRTSKIWL